VLIEEDQPRTHRTVRQIARKQKSRGRHKDLKLKCFKRKELKTWQKPTIYHGWCVQNSY